MIVKKKGMAVKRGMKRRAPRDEEIEVSSGEEENLFEQPHEEKKMIIQEESEDSGNDSDKELQIALRDGLLKDGLNYVVEKKRPIINKKAEILKKITKFAKKLPWIETLEVVTKSTLTKEMINNDFEREMQFYKQAEQAVQQAVPKLLTMGVKVIRPTDYYAEMAKTDDHMQKVRKRLLKVQEGKERQEAFRRMREEKKFAKKVQKQAIENKTSEKKKLMDAVKKHKKGMKQQLEDMLNNVKKYNLDKDDDEDKPQRGGKNFGDRSSARGGKSFGGPNNRNKNFKRAYKNEKYGYGGKKKGMKRNTKESFEDVFDRGNSARGRGRAGGRGGGRGRGRR